MELQLNTTAVFNLFNSIQTLYKLYEENGIHFGHSSYKKIDDTLNSFLSEIQNDSSLVEAMGKEENSELVKELLQLIVKSGSTKSLSNALSGLEDNGIGELGESINVERLDRAISLIENNLENADEEFWQSCVFKDNQWVLSQLFSSPCTIFKDKAYIGGKNINNQNGNICDFIYKNQMTANIALIEIKTPKTQIINGQYRHTFSFTYEMSGAVNQIINYRDSLMKEYYSLKNSSEASDFVSFNPKCVVIIGNLSTLTKEQVASFENYRNSLNNIEIITYDEILLRLKNLYKLFTTKR